MTFFKLHSLKMIKESEPADQNIDKMRNKMILDEQKAWEEILNLMNIDDESIINLLFFEDSIGDKEFQKVYKSIYWLYTLETPIYKELNRAN